MTHLRIFGIDDVKFFKPNQIKNQYDIEDKLLSSYDQINEL